MCIAYLIPVLPPIHSMASLHTDLLPLFTSSSPGACRGEE